MKIASRWKIVFDPTGTPKTLLDHGQYIDQELAWNLNRAAEVIQLAEASAPFLRPMGNNVYTLDFTVYPAKSTDNLARVEVMDALAAVDNYGKKPLRIYAGTEAGINSLPYWQFASAIVRSFAPKREMVAGRPRYAMRYSITAVTLTKTTS